MPETKDAAAQAPPNPAAIRLEAILRIAHAARHDDAEWARAMARVARIGAMSDGEVLSLAAGRRPGAAGPERHAAEGGLLRALRG